MSKEAIQKFREIQASYTNLSDHELLVTIAALLSIQVLSQHDELLDSLSFVSGPLTTMSNLGIRVIGKVEVTNSQPDLLRVRSV